MSGIGRALAAPAIARDRLVTDRAALAVVTSLVLLLALVAAAMPRLLAASADAGLREAVAVAPPVSRNLEFSLDGQPGSGGPAELTDVGAAGAALRSGLPPRVAGLVTSEGLRADSAEHLIPDAPVPVALLRFRVQPGADALIRYVEGRAPTGAVDTVRVDKGDDENGVPFEARRYEAAISSRTAEILGLGVGDEWVMLPQPDQATTANVGTRNLGYVAVRIVGRFDVIDLDDPAWFADTSLYEPGIEIRSIELRFYHATVLAAPDAYAALNGPQSGSSFVDPIFPMHYRWLMGVDGGRVDAASVDALLTDLARLRAAHPLLGAGADVAGLQTNLDGLLATARTQQATAGAVLLVAAAGPAVGAAALIALVALLLAHRRSVATAVIRSRGASVLQVLAARSLEGLAVACVAGAGGLALAVLIVPARPEPTPVLAAAATGAIALLALVAAAWPDARATTSRHSSRARAGLRPGAGRLVLDLLVVIVAVAAAGALLGRGLRIGGDGVRPDPLLAAAPALLAVAGGLVTVRILPAGVAVLAVVLRGRRDLVPVLAARSSARQSGGSVLPLLAVVVATAFSVFAATVTGTIEAGQDRVTWQTLGADVRLTVGSGRTLPGPLVQDAPAAAAAVADARVQPALVGGPGIRPVRLRVVAIDAEAFAEVLRGTPLDGAVPPALFGTWTPGTAGTAAAPVPVLAAPATLGRSGFVQDGVLEMDEVAAGAEFRLAGTITDLPGLAIDDRTLVVPLAAVRAAQAERQVEATHRFARAVEGRGALLAGAYATLAEPYLTVVKLDLRADALGALRGAPLVTLVRLGFAVAIGISLVLAAAALVAGLVLVTLARTGQLAILRTLGLARSQVRALILLEQLPLVVLAVAAGVVVGVGLSLLLVPTLGLTAFTGTAPAGTGAGGPAAIVLDPLATAQVAVLPVVVVVVVVGAAAWATGRTDLARSVRMGG